MPSMEYEWEYLAAYTFKEAFPEANISQFREFLLRETKKKNKLKKLSIYRKYVVLKMMGCLSNLNWIIMPFEDLHFSVPAWSNW